MTRQPDLPRHCFGLACCVMLTTLMSVRGQHVEWTRQQGTHREDVSYGVSADGLGSVYVSGYTFGNLSFTNLGQEDAFLSKYDSTGNLLWIRQFGTGNRDRSYDGVSADGLGNVYVSGWTQGDLGGKNAGASDAFVRKYDSNGALQWTRQLGTNKSDVGFGLSADGLGGVYITGYTTGDLDGSNAGAWDAFLTKYDSGGIQQWTRQLGSSGSDNSYSVSADDLGNVYISGVTDGNLVGTNAGGRDVFVSKYDSSGVHQWTRQLGSSSDDLAYGVSADGLGNIYISGYTYGNLGEPSAGYIDAFVGKYDSAGTLQWMRQFGTSDAELSYGVSADGLGGVYISGWTDGTVTGTSSGYFDAFVRKYDSQGTLQWTQQLGTETGEFTYGGASADRLGNVYISGFTYGSFGGINAGAEDVFVTKLRDRTVPEPGTLVPTALATANLWLRRLRPKRSPRARFT